MKWTKLHAFIAGSLAFGLTTQSLLSYALTVNLPNQLVTVKYPEAYQQTIDEIAVCILEAEQAIYDEKTLKKLPKLPTSETRTCHEILKTKPYKNNITFQVKYNVNLADTKEDGELIVIGAKKQDQLTILNEPLKLNDSVYNKDTEALEIAMRMFQDLNIGFYGELSQLHQENDILDMLYLRIFNMVYELPKSQGHPLMIEFMKDIRDNYFRVTHSQFFQALVFYADKYNPDKELSDILKRYLTQIGVAGSEPGHQKPDENQALPGEGNSSGALPPLTDFDETAKEEFENVWDNAYQDAVAEEDKEDAGNHYGTSEPSISYETLKTYQVQDGVCMRVTITTKNGKEVKRETKKAPSSEIYRCGDVSLLGDATFESEGSMDNLKPIVSYRYGGNDYEWVHTSIKAKNGTLTYAQLTDLLMTISSELSVGYLQDSNRWLFILSGKPLYLEKYKDGWSTKEINQWLTKAGIDLQFGLNIEEQADQEAFFEWLEEQKELETETNKDKKNESNKK